MIEQLVLSVPDLIDMAVGSPELNINLLNAVLHILASQTKTDGTRVQLSYNAPLAHKAPQRTNPPNTFTVFNVQNASPDGQLDLKKCRLEPQPIVSNKPVNTLVVIDNSYTLPQLYIRNDVVEKMLPNASELVSACREDDGKTLVQMLDLLNITKRIEAMELSIEKVMSLICELCKSRKNQSPAPPAVSVVVPVEKSIASVPQIVSKDRPLNVVASATPTINEDPSLYSTTPMQSSVLIAQKSNINYEEIKKDLYELRVDLMDLSALVQTLQELPFRIDRLASFVENQHAQDPPEDSVSNACSIGAPALITDLELRIAQIEAHCHCTKSSTPLENLDLIDNPVYEERSLSRSIAMSTNFTPEDLIDMKREHDNLTLRVSSVEKMTCTLQNEMVRLFTHLEDHGKFAKSTRCQLLDFINTFEELRQNVHGLNVDVNMLVRERIDRMRQYEAIIDQMEQIKCVKADREEVEQMVVVKADITEMRTKVPFSQFEDMRKDLSLSLIDALEKIVETDIEWHRAIDSIHELLHLKLDKSEAKLMAEDMTNRMIALKDKLRGFGMFRLSCESAATSEKYLKNVKCLACNAQTYMKPTLSLPEISRLGKFGRIEDPEVRNFARITVPCSMRKEIKEPQSVLRFCGGRHTKLAKGEKYTIKGNFIAQTGGVPLHSNLNVQLACGTDGALYRVDLSDCNCGDS